MVYRPVEHSKDMSGVEALCKAAAKVSWPDGALRELDLGDNFLGDHGEWLLRKAMNKPAVLAERAREEREYKQWLEASRRDCREGRCDSSCIWCDCSNGGC